MLLSRYRVCVVLFFHSYPLPNRYEDAAAAEGARVSLPAWLGSA